MAEVIWQLESVGLAGRTTPRLAEVNLSIESGVTAVVGESGAGKTSLLNLLVGFEKPTSGRVGVRQFDQTSEPPMYWVPADGGLWPHVTVRGHLAAVTTAPGVVSEILETFDLAEISEAKPGTLSDGQRSRVSIARALASGARLVVMDEPLVHVDPARCPGYWAAIRRWVRSGGRTLIFSSHEPEVVLAEAERVIVLHAGRVRYVGGVDELYERPGDAGLAACLGPANWCENGDGRELFGQDIRGCVRPERVDVTKNDQGDWVVVESVGRGATAETRLALAEQARAGGDHEAERVVYHRAEPGRRLRSGQRVAVRLVVILLLMMAGLAAGCDREDGARLEFSQTRVHSMPAEGTRIPGPRAVAMDGEGGAYVLDTAGRVIHFDAAGESGRMWWMPDVSAGRPEDVLVLGDGRIAVADTHYSQVVFFDENGTVLSRFGERGEGEGQFIFPIAMAEDDSGRLYVAEYGGNDRVQVFDAEGNHVLTFGSVGTGPGELQRPSGLVWHDGKVYVADAINNRIQVWTDTGELIGTLGGDAAVSLAFPYDLAIDGKNQLAAVEYTAGRVTVIDLNGRLVGRYGTTGRGEGEFSTPWGMDADAAGRMLVADTGNRRLVELVP